MSIFESKPRTHFLAYIPVETLMVGIFESIIHTVFENKSVKCQRCFKRFLKTQTAFDFDFNISRNIGNFN